MKPIELTEEHKKKIFEISDSLFKDTPIFEIDKDGYILFFSKDNQNAAIHWFEFCIKILGKKIFDIDSDDDKYYEFIGECYAGDNNPIEYLYEQFKNLKL